MAVTSTLLRARGHLALLALLLVCGPAWGQAAVETKNADFERADATGKLPADWVYIAPQDGDGSLALGEGRDGGHAAQVTCTRLDKGWGPGFGQVGVVALKADQWYEARFWARGEGLTRGVFVAVRDTTDWSDNRLWQLVFAGPLWREFRLRFHSTKALPAEVSRFQFSFDSTGTLWVDDVRIVEAEPDKPANVLAVEGRKNLLPNGSFEAGAFGWATYGADELFGELDPTTAADGQRSFRITLEDGKLPVYYNDFTYRLRAQASRETLRHLPLCPIGYCPVAKGKPVTFSFQIKASRDGLPVIAHLIEGSGKATTRTFSATTQWQRLSFTATPQAEIAFVVVGLDATPELELPATLWLDALQLELGDQPTDYEPAFPVELALDTGHEGNTYLLGEKVAPRLSLVNLVERDQTVRVAVEVEDFFGSREERYARDVPLKAAEAWGQDVDLGITQPGFYRLHLTLSGDGWRTSRSLRAAVIYPFEQQYPGADGFLGINHAFVSDLYMRRARAMGLTWVRSWFCKWQDVQPQPGAPDFAEADAQYERLRGLGVHVQLCLADPTSEWASTAPDPLEGTTGGEAQSRRVWWLPRSFDLYEAYVRAVAEHFRGKVRHYEVFNEPSDRKGGESSNLDLAHTYLTFLATARRAVRAASADSLLLGAGLGYLRDAENLSLIVASMDILSEHRYPGLQPTSGMLADFAGVRETLAASRGERPIWITEYGLYADDDPDPTTADSRFTIHYAADSERLAATYAAKHHIVALASGVEKVFYHIGNWPFVMNREHGCCFHPFFEWAGVPRKTLVALNTLAWVLPPGTRHVRSWTGPNQVFGFDFRHADARVCALWCEGGVQVPQALRDRLKATGVGVTDVSGARLEVLPGVLGEAPLYLSARGAEQVEAVEGLASALRGG